MLYQGSDTHHTLTPDELESSGIQFKPAREWKRDDPPRLLHVSSNGQPTRIRRYTVLSGVTPTSGLGVYNNTVRTVERALLERYFMIKTKDGFKPPLHVRPRVFKHQDFGLFRTLISDYVRPIATVYSDVQTVALYTGPKHRLYHNAMISLSRTSLNRSDAKIKQFPKMEKQDLGKAPRIINPRTPRYNLCLARWLKKLEKQVYEAINAAWGGRTNHTIIKGLNCFDAGRVIRAKWLLFKQPVAIGLDATKWDAHVTRTALEYEHSVYNAIFRSKELRQLLSMQLVNHGKSFNDDGTVEFIIEGTRASGDINTSLGNCLLASAMAWVLCRRLGITAEFCNNGDDCVLIMESSDVAKFMESVEPAYQDWGFRMEVEKPVDVFEQLEFCQTHPVFDGVEWRMVRNPLACFKKDGMCLLPITNQRTYQRWLGAVGECGLAAASGIPVLQEWYSMFKRSGKQCPKKFKRFIFAHTYVEAFGEGLSGSWRQVTPEARVSFFNATGITPDMQLAYERAFSAFTLETQFQHAAEELHVCKSIPIIELAPDIFDNSEHLTYIAGNHD